MSSEATQLKLRALELKKAGDLDGAKQLLAQARAIEFENITVEELNDAGELKRLAVVLKRKGDIAGAKRALAKAKSIEAAGDANVKPAAAAAPSAQQEQRRTSSPPRPSMAQQASARIPCLFNASSSPGKPGADEGKKVPASTTNDPADDGRSTNYLAQTDSVTAELQEELNPTGPVTFDDDEMADVETMADLQSMGMDMPTEEQYHARVKANKLEALAAKKRGDIEAAKRHLYKSKQLEAARIQLYANKEEEDEFDDEDYSLLDELNGGSNEEDDAFFAELFGAEDNNLLDLDDLDHFDAEMLRDMIDAGMVVPDPDDVLKEAQEKKALAVSLHKQGNSTAAKAALAESKKLQSQAERLAEMMAESNAGDGESGEDMAALMELLEGSDSGSRPVANSGTKGEASAAPPAPKAPTKTAQEWKVEAVKMKQEGKLTEATKALRMYKQTMAEEANKVEMEKRQKTIAELTKEIEAAEDQIDRFIFYERFVDAQEGAAQLAFWRKYAMDCSRAAKLIETKGTGSIAMSRKKSALGKSIVNEDLSFIHDSVDPSDERLEIAFLGASNIHENKHLKKALRQRSKELQQQQKDKTTSSVTPEINPSKIRIDVTIQLPPSEKESDGNIQFSIEPKPINNQEGSYQAESCSKYIDLPRGKSTYAKMIVRRMERKRIQFTVVYVPPSAKKGIFGLGSSRKTKDAASLESSLGVVSFELREFLQNRSIAGDFPIMDTMRRNELGGSIRVGIRTGIPFDLDAIEAQSALTELTGYKLSGVDTSSTSAELEPFEALIFTAT